MDNDLRDQLIFHLEAIINLLKREGEKETSKRKPQKEVSREADSEEVDASLVLESVNLEGWYMNYREEAKPAKYMGAWELEPGDDLTLTRKEDTILQVELKRLDGTLVNGGTHVFTCIGKPYRYERQLVTLYQCIPVSE